MDWLKAFDSDVAKGYYIAPLDYWEYKWTRKIKDTDMWNFVRSLSYINRLSSEEKQVIVSSAVTDNRYSRVI